MKDEVPCLRTMMPASWQVCKGTRILYQTGRQCLFCSFGKPGNAPDRRRLTRSVNFSGRQRAVCQDLYAGASFILWPPGS